MSDYEVVSAVSEAVRRILWDEFRADSKLFPQLISSMERIVFSNPTETARDSDNKLSLWLYQITENEHMKNQPPARARQQPPQQPGTNGREALQGTPMALNLYYLVTPFVTAGQAEHMLLGKTMQVLYDNATIFLRDPNPNRTLAEELRVVFCRMTLEELTRIWEALREPYRLSVCYLIRITHIDSRRITDAGRVVERDAAFNSDPESVAEV